MNNTTVVKVIGIISLITFLIGVAVSIFGIVGGNYFFNVSTDAYETYETTDPGADLLVAIVMLFGSSFLGAATMIGGINPPYTGDNSSDIIAWLMIGLAVVVGACAFIGRKKKGDENEK